MATASPLSAPLCFVPVYKQVVWGGRRMAAYRDDLPEGPVGESWDLADHPDGQSVVVAGPLAGKSLGELLAEDPEALVGPGFSGGPFPLLIKLIDATQRLSVQVHPDDELARAMALGQGGKTECWLVLADGGEIFQGTRPGVDRAVFEQALAEGRLADLLNRFECQADDFFFLGARTVHALGAGCLVYEIQQTSNITFRVYDWGRVGLDGKPRPLHVAASLDTIDFSRTGFGPQRPPWQTAADGSAGRLLADCPFFRVEERRGSSLHLPTTGGFQIVTVIEGAVTVSTVGGAVEVPAKSTVLIPAAAGAAEVRSREPAGGCTVVLSGPGTRIASRL